MMKRIALLVLAVSGCTPFPWDPPEGFLTSAIIGPEGGRIDGPGVSLDVPAGALDDATEISIHLSSTGPAGYDLHAPVYRFEPDGLEFARPVWVSIEAPEAPLGSVLLWSRARDPSSFEVAGFVHAGVAAAQITHFSVSAVASPNTCSAGEEECTGTGATCAPGPDDDECATEQTAAVCPDECGEGGEMCTSACADGDSTCGTEPCRSLCRCDPFGEPRVDLCVVNPGDPAQPPYTQTLATCPGEGMHPTLGPHVFVGAGIEIAPDGRQMPGERNGAPCSGFRIETEYRVVCDCVDRRDVFGTGTPVETFLCPRAWEPETPGATTRVCITRRRDSLFGEDAPAPDRSVGEVGYGTHSFVPAVMEGWADSAYNGGRCTNGHWKDQSGPTETDGGRTGGNLINCRTEEVGSRWVEASGEYHSCRRYAPAEGTPQLMLSAEDQARCRLTPDEWSHLQNRRADCGLPPRTLAPNDGHTLAILSSPGVDEITGLNGTTGGAQPLRSAAVVAGSCPMPLARRHTPEDGGAARRYRGAGRTHCHAEGDALEQLAVLRGRVPSVAVPGTPFSGWGAEGGTIGGSAEMIEDRSPCRMSCGPYGIDRMRQIAGLEELVVRSPEGTRRYGPGAPASGAWVD